MKGYHDTQGDGGSRIPEQQARISAALSEVSEPSPSGAREALDLLDVECELVARLQVSRALQEGKRRAVLPHGSEELPLARLGRRFESVDVRGSLVVHDRPLGVTRALVVLPEEDQSIAVSHPRHRARGRDDRVLAFELGADDFVTKPFSPREVVLRTRAVLRRRAGPEDDAEAKTLRIGPIQVDLETYRAWVAEAEVDLTITEFRLLADLMHARGRVRTREWLLSEVWGYDSEVMSRTVDTHVRRLRDKLGFAASWLETVRGVGFRLREPASE